MQKYLKERVRLLDLPSSTAGQLGNLKAMSMSKDLAYKALSQNPLRNFPQSTVHMGTACNLLEALGKYSGVYMLFEGERWTCDRKGCRQRRTRAMMKVIEAF
ncbi:hypothetical protein M758_12G080100 [Ceratodon purpureus]|nr:hypothetical protein M758_12G080100 [Ceratodon purpureus]